MSKNPYAEVALTYLRRPFSSVLAVGLFTLVLLLMIPLWFGIACEPRNALIPTLILFICFSSLATVHVIGQFANPRARLMPHFFRVHLTVAAGVVLAIGVFGPAMVTWSADYYSVGMTAIVIVSFGGAVCAQLIAPGSGAWLGFIWILLFIPSAEEVVQQLVSGKLELQAWGLLILGVAALVLGGIRLLRLREDTPNYARLVRRDRAGWNEKVPNGPDSKRPAPWPWEARQEAASAIRHSRRATASRWSRIRRWQVGVITARHVLPWIFVEMLSLLSRALSGKRDADVGMTQVWLIILPGIVAMTATYQRPVTMATQLCLPVARRDYLKQLGAATLLSYLEVWFVLCAPFVLWCIFAKPRADLAEVGRVLAVSFLILIWFYGVGVWFARFRSPTSLIPLNAIGLSVLLFILTMRCLGLIIESGSSQLPAAALAAVIGILLAGDAYRRWLITDLE